MLRLKAITDLIYWWTFRSISFFFLVSRSGTVGWAECRVKVPKYVKLNQILLRLNVQPKIRSYKESIFYLLCQLLWQIALHWHKAIIKDQCKKSTIQSLVINHVILLPEWQWLLSIPCFWNDLYLHKLGLSYEENKSDIIASLA